MSRQIVRSSDLPARPSEREASRGASRGAARGEDIGPAGATAAAPAAPGGQTKPDGYFDRLMKLIPGETVALYLTLYGILMSDGRNPPVQWIIVGVALVFNMFYMRLAQKVTDIPQLALIEAAVVVWIISLHGAQLLPPWYQLKYGSALMVLFTAAAPMLVK
jgi:hypothetical protein